MVGRKSFSIGLELGTTVDGALFLALFDSGAESFRLALVRRTFVQCSPSGAVGAFGFRSKLFGPGCHGLGSPFWVWPMEWGRDVTFFRSLSGGTGCASSVVAKRQCSFGCGTHRVQGCAQHLRGFSLRGRFRAVGC